jgi:hypothetical protein
VNQISVVVEKHQCAGGKMFELNLLQRLRQPGAIQSKALFGPGRQLSERHTYGQP